MISNVSVFCSVLYVSACCRIFRIFVKTLGMHAHLFSACQELSDERKEGISHPITLHCTLIQHWDN